jgi:hypothetical protein
LNFLRTWFAPRSKTVSKPIILGTRRWKEEKKKEKRQIGYLKECEGGDD